MNKKVKTYVDVLFSDVPKSNKARKLKEDLLAQMSVSFDEYISQGKTENQAYSLVVSNLEDVDEMLRELMPTDEFLKSSNYYRKRNARNTAISVVMYIIAVTFLIGFTTIGDFLGSVDVYAVVGLIIMLVISALATGILVYSNMSIPLEYKERSKPQVNKKLENLLSIYWISITFIYLAISFITMKWGTTWIIWILAAVFESIIKTVFEMREENE